MRRIIWPLALLFASPCWAGITQSDDDKTYQLGDKIVLKVELENVPEGAIVKGDVIPKVITNAENNSIHSFPGYQIGVWGTPGEYTVSVTAMWGVKHPTVEDAWSDFGLVYYETEFTVEGEVPDPPDPPDPNPGGPYKVWFLENPEQRDNLPRPQANLLTSLEYRGRLENLGHQFQRVVSNNLLSNPPLALQEVAKCATGKSLPGLVITTLAGGDEYQWFPLPDSFEALAKLLEEVE